MTLLAEVKEYIASERKLACSLVSFTIEEIADTIRLQHKIVFYKYQFERIKASIRVCWNDNGSDPRCNIYQETDHYYSK